MRHRLDRARQDLDRASDGAARARRARAHGDPRASCSSCSTGSPGCTRARGSSRQRTALGELERRLAAVAPGSRLARARTSSHALVGAARRGDAAPRSSARRAELGQLGAQLAALSPLAVLDRGYAMVRKAGAIVRDAAAVRPGDRLQVRLAHGSLAVTVDATGRPSDEVE